MLAACGDPMRNVDKLSDVDLSEETARAEIVEQPESRQDVEQGESGLFARMFGNNRAKPDAEVVSDAPVEETAEVAAENEPPETKPRRGFLGLLGAAPEKSKPEQDVAEATAEPSDAEVEVAVEERKPSRGLFGFLRNSDKAVEPAPTAEPVQLASLPADAEVATDAEPRRGLFGAGRTRQKASTSSLPEVPFGTVLPYGDVARVCNVKPRSLGKEIARYPERGDGYRIYDSAPGNTQQHTFYVTGFDDGCARQFTAALAMFGSPALHEQLRYGLPAKVQPYSDTDQAYEKLKSKVCNVGRRKPCGDKIGRLERNTVFVSMYERYVGSPRWGNLLIHDGTVLAKDIKGN